MLFLVPGNPYESYWKSMFEGRFVYGVLPGLGSVILLAIVGWLWDRSNGSRGVLKTISRAFALAAGAILLFGILAIVIAGVRNG
jgi:TRAP-type C4-dicarboxylate transport system permease large subunit